MSSRLWAARLVVIVVLFASIGWLAQAEPGASASASAGAGLAAGGGAGEGAGGGAATGSRASLAVPGTIRVVARQPAPLVTGPGPALSKRGLAPPPMTAAMLRANAAKQAAGRAFLRAKSSEAGPDVKCASRACRLRLPAARSLNATQQPQARDYYCGPATVSEMLSQVGEVVSQHAAARQLGTTRGGTDWSDARGYPVPHVLNAHQHRNVYVAVALPWAPTNRQVRTYENDLVADINRHGGAPLAGNAYEVPGGPHLAGHPENQEISHWFDIRGYRNSGATTEYEDSVHGASSIGWSSAVPAYSELSSRTIVNILGARGYDW
jgi:hypothetical protein